MQNCCHNRNKESHLKGFFAPIKGLKSIPSPRRIRLQEQTMNRHPILFVSHGAPDVLLKPGATVRLWETLGAGCPARGRSWSSRPTGPRGNPP
jgi:hypothetical protein